jgi:hypothetical protein
MKVLDSVLSERQAIAERLVVLNICKEAQSIGIKLRALPTSSRTCGRILSDMLELLCPGMEKQVQYCTIQSVARYRTVIEGLQATLCPWAVQILSIKDNPFSISKLVRTAIPMKSDSRYDGHVVGGPIGAFAKIHGFSIICRITPKGDTKFLAGSSNASQLENIQSSYEYGRSNDIQNYIAQELEVVKSNMASPLAFCRCIRMIYQELLEAAESANTMNKEVVTLKKKMSEIMDEKEKPAPKKESITPVLVNKTVPPKIEVKLVSRGPRFTIKKLNTSELMDDLGPIPQEEEAIF